MADNLENFSTNMACAPKMYPILLTLAFSSSVKCQMEMEGFIVGGEEVSIKVWPFIAFIEATLPKQQTSACGGSLLSSQTVLTAAHCLDDMTEKKTLNVKFVIYMGHSSFKNSSMMRSVQDYETHHNYDPASEDVHDDVGIMFLDSPVKFIHNVKKVILVKHRFDAETDKRLLVAGWGRFDTSEDVYVSPNLKNVKLTSITLEECAEKHPFIADISKLVCAAASKAYAYSGDSGGPLVQRKSYQQLGIVSFRNENTGVTMFTSVPEYYNWINQTNFKLYKKFCGE